MPNAPDPIDRTDSVKSPHKLPSSEDYERVADQNEADARDFRAMRNIIASIRSQRSAQHAIVRESQRAYDSVVQQLDIMEDYCDRLLDENRVLRRRTIEAEARHHGP